MLKGPSPLPKAPPFNIYFAQNNEYYVKFNAVCKTTPTNSTLVPKLSVCMSGSAFNPQRLDKVFPYSPFNSKVLGAITPSQPQQRYDDVVFYFSADNNGYGTPLFVMENTGDWYLSDIKIQAVHELGYSANDTWFIVPIKNPVLNSYGKNYADFKFEFYDYTEKLANQVVYVNKFEITSVDTSSGGGTGQSGYSGYSGQDGASSHSGYSGFSGQSGYSGYSGATIIGQSGYSGFSGIGIDGQSGYSGYSGATITGNSGYSGFSGQNGIGTSGYSGFSGQTVVGTSGYSGFSGATITGQSGYSGYSGTNAKARQHDWHQPYDYCGTAPVGSATSSAVWTITRITVASNGSTITSTLYNQIWDNRYSLPY